MNQFGKDKNEKQHHLQHPQEPTEKRKKKIFPRWRKESGTTIAIVLFLIMGGIIPFLIKGTITAGATALHDGFVSTFETEQDDAYSSFFNTYRLKNNNHVAVSVEGVRETAALEVLKVSDIEYIIENREDNKNGITSWLEVPGSGMYVVNLQAAEFIVDEERDYVLVRAPYPELTNITIDYANVKKMLFTNDFFNDSYQVGEDLARQQLRTADMLIKKEFASNQYFYLNAQKVAVSTIQCLVQQMNPEVLNLTVEVEFFNTMSQ